MEGQTFHPSRDRVEEGERVEEGLQVSLPTRPPVPGSRPGGSTSRTDLPSNHGRQRVRRLPGDTSRPHCCLIG